MSKPNQKRVRIKNFTTKYSYKIHGHRYSANFHAIRKEKLLQQKMIGDSGSPIDDQPYLVQQIVPYLKIMLQTRAKR